MPTVIKRGEQGTLLSHLRTIDLADHLSEARAVVAEARRRANEILAKAQAEAQSVRDHARRVGQREGREQGLVEGREQGRAEGLADATERFEREHASLASSMAQTVQALETEKRDLMLAAQRDMLELAAVVACKVTRRVCELNREAAVANVEEALRLAGRKTDVAFKVNPRDAETLQSFASEAAKTISLTHHVRFIEDESIAPGGALLVADGGVEVDARIETQLEQIVELLLGTPFDSTDSQAEIDRNP